MKPHIYRWDGRWWVSRGGRRATMIIGDPSDAAARYSFSDACQLAMLAAIYAGVWRA